MGLDHDYPAVGSDKEEEDLLALAEVAKFNLIPVVDAAARKNAASYPDGLTPFKSSVLQLDTGIIYYLVAADVTLDASWVGVDSKQPRVGVYNLLVLGESHALGRAISGGSESKNPVAGVKILSASSNVFEVWDVTDATQIQSPLNGGSGWSAGSYNSAFFAAKRINGLTGREVNVILEAEGGEEIANFVPETSNHWARLLAQIATAGWTSIDGAFLHQGANDTNTDTTAYLINLRSWIDQIEALLGWRLGNPIILGGLKKDSTQYNNIKVVSDERLSVGYVPFDRLDLLGDNTHWTANANIEAGSMIASQLLNTAIQSVDLGAVENPTPFMDFNASKGVVVNAVNDVDWIDSVGGRTMTTTTLGFNIATNTTNGLPELRRVGNGVLNTTLGVSKVAPYSFIAVMEFDQSTLNSANQYVLRVYNPSTTIGFYAEGGNSGRLKASGIGSGISSSPAPVGDTPVVVGVVYDGVTIKIYDESGLIGSGSAGANPFAGELDVGSSSHASDYGVQRLMFFRGALSDSQVSNEIGRMSEIYK